FTSNFRRVKEICNEIRHRGLIFSWSVFARADSVTQELLRVMRDAGCDTVFFGFESGNQEMLNRIKKRIKLDRVRKAVADCKTVGMNVSGSFIVGLPGETMETLMDSHRFAQELDVNYGYHFLAPFPGTDLKENINQYDLELLTDNWSDFDANRPIVRTSCLQPEDMDRFVENYYLRYVREDEAKIEKTYHNGTLGDQEKLRYVGKQKLDIVFRLLSEDILENAPPFPLENGLMPVKPLVEYLTVLLDKPMDFVRLSIQHLFDRGSIQYREQNQQAFCHWR
ncbi:MAG: radical SAM protein, partial [Desulfobacterales bacterium]|nr:radical SAM protein [Desulfobacterales bacterium]